MFRRLDFCLAATVSLAVMACAVTSQAADTGGDGYTMLYNGKDLTGWKTAGDWRVEEDGVLALKPKPGRRGIFSYTLFLWTKEKYSDFVLDFEYKLARGGDSSVFLRSKSLFSFIEVEVSDSYGKREPLTDDDCGAVVKVAAPTKNAAKPPGEWNRMIITCTGTQLQVDLNGLRVNDLDLAEASSRSIPNSGAIGFQDWGHPVWFRNIRIKEIE
jgi:hypothetical protein